MQSNIRSIAPELEKKNCFEIKSERISPLGIKPDEDSGYYYIKVRIYLDTRPNDGNCLSLDDVEGVEYKLHDSFGDDRFQFSKQRNKNFEIIIETYGYFDLKANVFTRSKTFELSHRLEFKVTQQEKQTNDGEFEW